MRFDLDPQKNQVNKSKHNISFEEACTIFNDPDILSIVDEEHSQNEDRWISISVSSRLRSIVAIHLFLTNEQPNAIRIISARKATKREISQYNSSVGK